jgi:uncharacterized protein
VTLPDGNLLELLDWKRRVFELYAEVRAAAREDPRAAWERWRHVRDELFVAHPQSPLPRPQHPAFAGLPYFDYDPAFRVDAEVERAEPEQLDVVTSGPDRMRITRFAAARVELRGEPRRLELFWLTGYGGGVFLSFRDATSGKETYGACRYLLDTVKGSDLGVTDDGRLVLDFNFAYNPSCSYDPRWVCPLAPPANRLDVAVRAGERYPAQPPHSEGAPRTWRGAPSKSRPFEPS